MKNFILILLINISIFSYSQTENIGVEFKYKTETIENTTAIFSIYGINTEQAANNLKNSILNDPNIISFKIFYNKRCKIIYNNNTDANYIRRILRDNSADYDMDYVIVLDKYTEEELYSVIKENYTEYNLRHTNTRGDWITPEDYPTYNTAEEKLTIEARRTEWIENNPERYKKMTGRDYLDIATNKRIIK